MDIRENYDLCEHIAAGDYPFQVELVMDHHLGLTDGVVSCRHCRRAYLLEMLDWANADRVFRISALDNDQARRLIRDLTRGSCDVQRAGAEVQHMKTATSFAPWLLLVDTAEALIRSVAPLAPGTRLPGQSWRELACDGSWVKQARPDQAIDSRRSSTEIENG